MRTSPGHSALAAARTSRFRFASCLPPFPRSRPRFRGTAASRPRPLDAARDLSIETAEVLVGARTSFLEPKISTLAGKARGARRKQHPRWSHGRCRELLAVHGPDAPGAADIRRWPRVCRCARGGGRSGLGHSSGYVGTGAPRPTTQQSANWPQPPRRGTLRTSLDLMGASPTVAAPELYTARSAPPRRGAHRRRYARQSPSACQPSMALPNRRSVRDGHVSRPSLLASQTQKRPACCVPPGRDGARPVSDLLVLPAGLGRGHLGAVMFEHVGEHGDRLRRVGAGRAGAGCASRKPSTRRSAAR